MMSHLRSENGNQNLRYWILSADLVWLILAVALGIYVSYAGSKEPLDFIARLQQHSLLVLVAVAAWTSLYFRMTLDGFKGGWRLFAISLKPSSRPRS